MSHPSLLGSVAILAQAGQPVVAACRNAVQNLEAADVAHATSVAVAELSYRAQDVRGAWRPALLYSALARDLDRSPVGGEPARGQARQRSIDALDTHLQDEGGLRWETRVDDGSTVWEVQVDPDTGTVVSDQRDD
jgi:hypothetical protein